MNIFLNYLSHSIKWVWLVVAFLLACQSNKAMAMDYETRRVDWDLSISAPRYYSIDFVRGRSYFTLPNGDKTHFSGSAGGGWVRGGGVVAGLDDKTQIPIRAHLVWLAREENQFYEADFEMPQKELYDLFKKGFISQHLSNPGEHQSYSYIELAIAPGGGVFVRVSGQQIKEVAYFKARKIELNWWDYMTTDNTYTRDEYIGAYIKKMPDDIRARTEKRMFPLTRWENYSQTRFPWQLQMTGAQLQEYWVSYVNGDRYMVFPKSIADEAAVQPKRVPNYFEVYFIAADGRRYRGELNFSLNQPLKPTHPDGDEPIFKLFNDYYQDAARRPAVLNFNIGAETKSIQVTLSDGVRTISIKPTLWVVRPVDGYDPQ